MAWMSSGRTNAELVDNMMANGLITSTRVAEAMRNVDRMNYVPDKSYAYEDSPQGIGYGATISAPHMHAHACENLLPSLPQGTSRPGSILDVGSGSGYLTAVFHHLSPQSLIVGIDHLQPLVDQSISNLHKDGIELGKQADGSGVIMICGDGRHGSAENGPFTVIHVGAAAPTIPEALVQQLARPGRMFIPVGEASQDIWQIDKSETGEVTQNRLFGVRYVPLTDPDKQWREKI
ncbi:protein-L-isoaspartate O-methyltransferase [Kwoniella newhampshirensis]|uniref:protein-L-isoaspartate(D-aspartate) O-methyltransferase n=1 Tax=Kwoniella newhampshirensis TaxID=1651941 RepID=A0AAW0Z6N9_9TREE